MPTKAINLRISSRPMCLVPRSAGLSLPGHFSSVIRPCLTSCWTHRSATARCRILPNPLLLQMPIAAAESAYRRMCTCIPKSAARLRKPMASAVPFTIPASSASPELKVKTFWVELQCLMAPPSIAATPPLVDFRVTLHPAQSESEYPVTSCSWPCQSYFMTVRPLSMRHQIGRAHV